MGARANEQKVRLPSDATFVTTTTTTTYSPGRRRRHDLGFYCRPLQQPNCQDQQHQRVESRRMLLSSKSKSKRSRSSKSKRMYSPGSPTFSSLDRSSAIATANAAIHSSSNSTTSHNFPQFSGASLSDGNCDGSGPGGQCVRFKYFTIFIVSTTCLALLSASLATHKWIISKPVRILRLNGGQAANLSSLMFSMSDGQQTNHDRYRYPSALLLSLNGASSLATNEVSSTSHAHQAHHQHLQNQLSASQQKADNKFQGQIYFGLFKGVKVLNYGFGDRYSPISVWQTLFSKPTDGTGSAGPQQATGPAQAQQIQQELVSFKLWLLTLVSVILASLFALIGSIFAIINFVIIPRGTLSGPVGLVIWNAAACFACLLATISWLIEYFVRLQTNVLSQEEIQNGWTSENRSQFGFSYYFVVTAFVLHLVNIFIVSIVQFETWNQNKAAKRQSRALCEGVIMLY